MKKNILLITAAYLFFLSPIYSSNGPESGGSNFSPHTQISLKQNPFTKGVISNVKWSKDGKYLDYINYQKRYRFDLKNKKIVSIKQLSEEDIKKLIEEQRSWRRRRREITDPRIKWPARGRQFTVEKSPDGKWYSICENWNVVLENTKTHEKITVTSSGNRKYRFGSANWVYGEELDVRHAMWWTPDSKKLIYYVFDERPVKDFYLIGNLTGVYTTSMVEGYTKAGDPNPIVSLEIYDLQSKTRTPIDCGKGEYFYNMRFTPDGTELLFNRTDRHQRILDVVAINLKTLEKRIVVREIQGTWQENSPEMIFLSDGKRFIWETEKSGWKQYELRHIDGSLICTLTRGEFPAIEVIHVDEDNGYLYYTAYSDKKNPLCAHLHRVRLNGKGQKRITRLTMNHNNINISPNGKWFTVQYEDIKTPPSSALYTTNGKLVTVLAKGPKIDNPRAELFTFKARDGVTDLYGILFKPENFDPSKKYPLIVSVYGGPTSRAVYNTFQNGHSYNKYGYLVAKIDNRGTSGRGKKFKDYVYGRLGDIDIQDQADGVRYLTKRDYVDANRVGIVGHSYGGYMAAIGILKYPDVFAVAVDRAGPTWWRNYDSIYTERYMNLPQDNPEGYANGNCMNFVKNLKGHLLIMHGLVDDNVHPTNAFQFIEALNKAGKFKNYECRFFPRGTHGFGGRDMQMEFFDRYLKGDGEK